MTSTERPGAVTCQIVEGVADVRLNRPDKLNALDPGMFKALAATGDRLAADRGVRVVVLSGEGRGFCAGLDFASFQAMAADGGAADGGAADGGAAPLIRDIGARLEGRITNLGQHAVHVWKTLPVPVIAAIHGPALGGGLQIALGADLRIVAPDAKLAVLEIRWGLIPDMTGTWALPRLVGIERAKELTWTGRMVSGTEAVQIGLASQVADDPRATALALAGQLAASSPQAIQAAKTLLERSLISDEADQYLAESASMSRLIGSPDQVEAVHAYFEKRLPVFKG